MRSTTGSAAMCVSYDAVAGQQKSRVEHESDRSARRLITAHCRLGRAVKSKGALLMASLTVPTYAERVMAPLLAYALSLARLIVGGKLRHSVRV